MRRQIVGWLTASLLFSGNAWAQTATPPQPVETKMRSETMAQIGMASILVGISMFVGYGTTYHVLEDDYCVTDYRVSAGSCRSGSRLARYGGLAIGTGVALMVIGNQKVVVKPTVTKTTKAVTAVVTW